VIPTKLIQYYESLVDRQRRKPAEENPHLREYIAEIRDVWEARGHPPRLAQPGRLSNVQWGSRLPWKNQNPDA
jgi:hypothetical protein